MDLTIPAGPIMLHVLAATLSLLLLAGMFAASPAPEDNHAVRPADRGQDDHGEDAGND